MEGATPFFSDTSQFKQDAAQWTLADAAALPDKRSGQSGRGDNQRHGRRSDTRHDQSRGRSGAGGAGAGSRGHDRHASSAGGGGQAGPADASQQGNAVVANRMVQFYIEPYVQQDYSSDDRRKGRKGGGRRRR